MIRSILLASVALVSVSALASAADLPTRMAAPAPVAYAAPVFTWTGFYVGVNAGAAWSGKDGCAMGGDYNNGTYTSWNGYGATCDSDRNTSFIGGGQAGFNYQMGALVLGLEGDIDWMGRGHGHGYDYDSTTTYVEGGPYEGTYSYRGGHAGETLSTIRGRLGFGIDRALFYVTGGVAFRDSGSNGTVVYDDGNGGVYNYTHTSSDNNVGWAIGGGLEYALTNNVSAKLEYIHAQFDKDNGYYTSTDINAPAMAFSGKRDNSVDAVRVGLNFRFGAPAAAVSPVTARY